ncbi:MAG TPA: translation initiation factor IF-3, partial [Candidatus Sumerlaeota bacterium]|nr:translation initiation factor IF-3 [Candidatus Sumerlaeota bacterium]
MNHQIRVKEVRLIDSNGEQVGIVPIEEALRKAEAQQLDLVEVSPDAVPPVCKIYDYKKVLYERKKKLKESKKKATTIHLKEVKMRVAIDSHDRDFKLKHAREFLEKGDKVKFTVIFRGREVTKPEMGDKLV